MIIFFNVGILFIVLLTLGIGGGYVIISNMGPILLGISVIIAFFGGGYILLGSFKKETILKKL